MVMGVVTTPHCSKISCATTDDPEGAGGSEADLWVKTAVTSLCGVALLPKAPCVFPM